jgi:hypothetical protein
MTDRSVVYNNAGVRLLEFGNHSAALELFRGALESKLTQERIMLHNSNNGNGYDDDNMDADNEFDMDDMNEQPQRCVSPDDESDDGSNSNTTEVRENQSNEALDSYLDLLNAIESQQQQHIQGNSSNSTPTNQSPSPTRTVQRTTPVVGVSAATTTAATSTTYEPYLYTIPFLIHETDMTSSSSSIINGTQSVSCRIVFNIGLIHQMVCRSTNKVASFYEIAATLLSSLPVVAQGDEETARIMILLRIAILNNFGVWCYENGEGESMMNSFEQLVETIDDDQALLSNYVDSVVVQGVRANIQAFLTPQNGVSMAA